MKDFLLTTPLPSVSLLIRSCRPQIHHHLETPFIVSMRSLGLKIIAFVALICIFTVKFEHGLLVQLLVSDDSSISSSSDALANNESTIQVSQSSNFSTALNGISWSTPPTLTTRNIAIVTAFSENHKLEGVAMLRSLIAVHFKGPVYIFLMKQSGEDIQWITEFKEELSKSPLSLRMIDFEIPSSSLNKGTYCFKPTAMGVFLRQNSLLPPSESAQVVMWSDASTRFLQNPSIWAKHIIQQEIDFVGRKTAWNIRQQTHKGTFKYFGMTPEDYNDHPPIAATSFLVNLQREGIRRVLNRWVDCGVLDCHACMAPIGSSKNDPNGANFTKGGNEYVSHRQDQSVLTLLVTDYMKNSSNEANVKIIGDHEYEEGGTLMVAAPYFCLVTRRYRGDIQSVRDWNTTFTIPPHACINRTARVSRPTTGAIVTGKNKILKYRDNNTIVWEDEDFAT